MNRFPFNRGPVFSASTDPAGGNNPVTAGGSGGSDPYGMEAMFNSDMSSQAQSYAQMNEEEQQKNQLQQQGDAALKALKAISIS